MVLLPVGMIGCITCSHKVVSPAFGDVNVSSPNPDGIAPWYTHAYIQGYTVMQKITYNIYRYIYIFILHMFLDNNTLAVVCLLGWHQVTNVTFWYINMFPLQTKDPISQAQQVGFAVTITGVLLWSRLKLQEQAGRGNQWMDWELCLSHLKLWWSLGQMQFFSPKSKYAFWGEERPLSKFCGIYPFTSTRESSTAYLSCRGGVEHGPCTAQADRQRDPERLPLAKQELRGCRMCRLQVVTCCTG